MRQYKHCIRGRLLGTLVDGWHRVDGCPPSQWMLADDGQTCVDTDATSARDMSYMAALVCVCVCVVDADTAVMTAMMLRRPSMSTRWAWRWWSD